MANIVITSTNNSIVVDFGTQAMDDMTKGTWRKDKIISFTLHSDHVNVITQGGSFQVANTATTGSLLIDSVNGVSPSSLDDLYTKLAALIA